MQGGRNGYPARPPRPRHRPSPICVCPSFLLFFLFFREKKRDVLFFLFFQKKKRKNQRKETLTGRGMSGNNRAGRSPHTLSVFPCGAFLKEKPRKIFFAGKASAADGRAQRYCRSRFLSFLFGSFSFTERKRTEEKPRKIFFAGKASSADGRAQRLFPGRVPGFLFWFSFLSPERKENEKPPERKENKFSGKKT